ncbi:related to FMC1-mitochondrial matrix protein, required for assembly of F1F0 ATP synthase [Ustilago bromivora]|uniref:Related to FMC1-mitochondrial matrix protein, required for assembly of F1F0 ATP synthase n=1 Tax=Ustilago bromivora TaxID=307758 RepID=A0A1K0FW77_9BASI|nr:related to FMC1-mitochondrial matrix protein, required for assembly of F1F0 ATP synthase [Ustilago bromivora]
MFATTRRASAVKTLYQNVLKEAERLVRIYMTTKLPKIKEYKDAENGTITDSKNSASSSYTPFIAPQKSSAEFRQQNLENLHVFLKNKALHAELLQRYNPTTGMTEEERIRLTARRVGLDVPITHDASAESANNYRKSAQIAQDQYKQDKDNREDQLYSGKGDGLNVGGPLRPPVFKE